MTQKSLAGLIVLNVALLGTLGLLSFSPSPADAQIRRAGDYIMVAATTPGRLNNTVYITDLNNQAMLAVTYDQSRRAIVPLGARDISGDFAAAAPQR